MFGWIGDLKNVCVVFTRFFGIKINHRLFHEINKKMGMECKSCVSISQQNGKTQKSYSDTLHYLQRCINKCIWEESCSITFFRKYLFYSNAKYLQFLNDKTFHFYQLRILFLGTKHSCETRKLQNMENKKKMKPVYCEQLVK